MIFSLGLWSEVLGESEGYGWSGKSGGDGR